MKVLLALIYLFALSSTCSAQGDLCESAVLNKYITQEVNKYRKKAKVGPLYSEPLLKLAADDHAAYMQDRDKLTHFQKYKHKKTPKNRVDYYGEQFNTVGENVQQTWVSIAGKHNITTCQDLAQVLVTGWRNSPPHYANMISEDYTTTFTSVNISPNGKIYACQLFGSDAYKNSNKDSLLDYVYKPDKEARCRRCGNKLLRASVYVSDDGQITFSGAAPMFKAKHYKRRIRFNWRKYGLAANIVLKEQYDCDTNIVFNGKSNVRGIPLEPVMKKDFRKGSNTFFWKFINIDLGTVPDWINQDYEVNLTVINNKRTCYEIIYNILPTGFHVDFKIDLYLDSLEKFYQIPIVDTLKYRIDFAKNKAEASDSLLRPISAFVNEHLDDINEVHVNGKASIEGSTSGNTDLYAKRAAVITSQLVSLGLDSSWIRISSEENFDEFRNDIVGTPYAYLKDSSNQGIKEVVNAGLANQLEPILSNHRYAEVSILATRYEKRQYDKDTIYQLFDRYVEMRNVHQLKKIQAAEYNLLLNKEISLDDIKKYKLPKDEKFIDVLCDRYLMIYRIDSLNSKREDVFMDSLKSLKKLDPKNERINTNIMMRRYPNWFNLKFKKSRQYYDTLLAERYMDPIIKARMALNLGTDLDWRLQVNRGKYKLLYPSLKRFIKPAKLDVHETFDLASYYTYFGDYHYAYLLTKRLVFKTQNPDEIVFFLKLIYYLDESLSDKVVIRYFKRIAQIKGDEFCTYFNSPYLNFQILDDPEIRKIYCETCSK